MQSIQLKIPAQQDNVHLLHMCLQSLFASTPLTVSAQQTLLVASIEAVNNCFQHAYANIENTAVLTVEVQINIYPSYLELHLYDQGCAFDSRLLKQDLIEPDPLAESGRGLFIIRQSVDSVQYWREQETNHWCFIKKL